MENELDIKDLIMALWRKKWLILIITVISFIISFLLFGGSSKTLNNEENLKYSETDFIFSRMNRTILVNNTVETTEKLEISNQVLSSLKKIVTSRDFLENAISDLQLSKDINIEKLQDNINILSNSDVITLIIGSENKELALKLPEKIINEIKNKAEILFEIKNVIIVDETKIVNVDKIKKIEKEIAETSLNDSSIPEVKILPSEKNGSSDKKKIILITAIGFIATCGIIVVIELFDTSIKSEEFLEKITNLKVLGRIPNISNLNQEEMFKILRVNLKECNTILVTSPEKGDGKSFVALNLAKAYEKLGKKVILIDLVKNSSDMVKKHDDKGLTDYLISNDNSTSNYVLKTSLKNLDILLAGKDLTNQTELLDSYKMKDTLKLLGNLYDIVIIDSSNILESSSTLTMTKLSKYTMLVVSRRKTKIENILKAKKDIEDLGGVIVGVVYNNLDK